MASGVLTWRSVTGWRLGCASMMDEGRTRPRATDPTIMLAHARQSMRACSLTGVAQRRRPPETPVQAVVDVLGGSMRCHSRSYSFQACAHPRAVQPATYQRWLSAQICALGDHCNGSGWSSARLSEDRPSSGEHMAAHKCSAWSMRRAVHGRGEILGWLRGAARMRGAIGGAQRCWTGRRGP